MIKTTEQHLKDGFQALNRGDLKTAGEHCQKLLAADPDLVPAHFLVGLVALEARERQVAHEAFKSVVKLDRNHAAAWAQLARLNVSEGRIDGAEMCLREIRRIQPTDP
jgi:Tfp pilus assembly protein PilF